MCLGLSVLFVGCDLLDPARPIAHPDTEIFGNLLELEAVERDGPAWLARVRVGMPRAFLQAEESGGRPAPSLEEGIIADVLITGNTVVLAQGRPARLEDLNPGSEVAVIPMVGSTRMMGTSNVSVEALYFTDFDSYRRWQLPGLARAEDVGEIRADPTRINSDGIERAPIPLAGGRVLYFTARLRPPIRNGEDWLGARRPGIDQPTEGDRVIERCYRTEIDDEGWSQPEPVVFPGLEEADSVRVSWVANDETRCLVTVEGTDLSWVAVSDRTSPDQPWGPVEPLASFEGVEARDAVYLAGSDTKIVCTVRQSPRVATDLWLLDPAADETPMPLQPGVNTAGAERSPRVGPDNELFFVRGDRQFVFAGGTLYPIAVPGPHRVVVTEAAPTADGRWVFMCLPNYRPVELDQDIHVAEWLGEGRLGEPVPVDDWRP
jgi:hypothetical protein